MPLHTESLNNGRNLTQNCDRAPLQKLRGAVDLAERLENGDANVQGYASRFKMPPAVATPR